MERLTVEDFPEFLSERRRLMAKRMRTYFEGL